MAASAKEAALPPGITPTNGPAGGTASASASGVVSSVFPVSDAEAVVCIALLAASERGIASREAIDGAELARGTGSLDDWQAVLALPVACSAALAGDNNEATAADPPQASSGAGAGEPSGSASTASAPTGSAARFLKGEAAATSLGSGPLAQVETALLALYPKPVEIVAILAACATHHTKASGHASCEAVLSALAVDASIESSPGDLEALQHRVSEGRRSATESAIRAIHAA